MPPASTTRVAPNVCCGRPLISQGRLPEARRLAAANVHALYDVAAARPRDRVRRAQLPVGGARGRAGPAARRAAAPGAGRGQHVGAVRGVPRVASARPGGPRWRCDAGPSRDPAPSALPPAIDGPGRAGQGAAVADSRRRRSSISMPAAAAWRDRSATRAITTTCRVAIGERKLLPAARAMTAGTVLVAAGTSCRHQVADLAGVTAVHPAVLLRSATPVPVRR